MLRAETTATCAQLEASSSLTTVENTLALSVKISCEGPFSKTIYTKRVGGGGWGDLETGLLPIKKSTAAGEGARATRGAG